MKQKILLNSRTKEYLTKIKDLFSIMQNRTLSSINTFSDNENNITITMDMSQKIHSIDISENLLDAFGKKEICHRLTQAIDNAIFNSGIRSLVEIKDGLSPKEALEIIDNESQEVKEKLSRDITQLVRELPYITHSFVSISGNISFAISGIKTIRSIKINDEFLCKKNKAIIEKELMETINHAIHKSQEEIQGRFMEIEKEYST
jgi:DNA-binding protein YbaB